jgi:hypothetical protein
MQQIAQLQLQAHEHHAHVKGVQVLALLAVAALRYMI